MVVPLFQTFPGMSLFCDFEMSGCCDWIRVIQEFFRVIQDYFARFWSFFAWIRVIQEFSRVIQDHFSRFWSFFAWIRVIQHFLRVIQEMFGLDQGDPTFFQSDPRVFFTDSDEIQDTEAKREERNI